MTPLATYLARRARRRARRAHRGLTLLEVLVSIGIIAMLGTLIYGAFDGMRRSREGIKRTGDRYHEGRSALARMTRELSSAFVSLNRPLDQRLLTRQTLFVGVTRSPVDRVDFTSFSHIRTTRDSHESDQNELSYFGSDDPNSKAVDLVRRESSVLDEDARRGGVVQVLAHDVDALNLAYLDPQTNEWVEEWDTMQASGQTDRLPSQVRIILTLNRGVGEEPVQFMTKVSLGMQTAIGLPTAVLGQLGLGGGTDPNNSSNTSSGGNTPRAPGSPIQPQGPAGAMGRPAAGDPSRLFGGGSGAARPTGGGRQ